MHGFPFSSLDLEEVVLVWMRWLIWLTDIYRTFGNSESVVAFSFDIKGAFNAIRPDRILHELQGRGVLTRMINFISYMITRKYLHFSSKNDDVRLSGIGVLQGDDDFNTLGKRLVD